MRQEWLTKAASSGFEDIENHKEELKVSKSIHLDTKVTYDAKQSYYDWARSKVNDGRFDSEKSSLIWELHSEATPRREIAPKVGFEQSWVTRKIKKIERYLKAESAGSGSSQLDLFFWSAPWEYVS